MTTWRIDSPEQLDIDDVREVRVRVVGGEVSVHGTTGSSAHLDVSDIDGELAVEYADGVLTLTQPGLTWERLLQWRATLRAEATLALAVPAGCPVQVGVVSASAMVSGLTGPTQVRSVSGRVTLDGLDGDITAQTVSGDVETLALTGSLRFKTVSGELTLAGGGGCREVTAKTVSGDMALDLSLDPGGAIALDTVSGDIVVRMPDGTGAKIEAQSTSGDLDSGFPGLTRDNKPGRKSLRGSIGDGAGSIRVRSVSGDVTLVPAAR
jgi:hypothetical protein